MRIWGESNKLCVLMDGMQLEIIPWGINSLRVIMLPVGSTDNRNWALTEAVPDMEPEITVQDCELKACWEEKGEASQRGTIKNGKIKAEIIPEGWICFRDDRG